MAKIKMQGLTKYSLALSRLSMEAKEKVLGPAVYQGADIVADAVRRGIQAIPEDTHWGTMEYPAEGPTPLQRRALQKSFGISRMRNDEGFFNVKLGFDGYNKIKSKRWPNGQPNAMVARSVERGTSFMKATPFMKNAISKVRGTALNKMKEVVDERIHSLMEK